MPALKNFKLFFSSKSQHLKIMSLFSKVLGPAINGIWSAPKDNPFLILITFFI